MIQNGSFLNVVDNSGAKSACCIRVLDGYRRRYARSGDIILVSIKTVRRKKKKLNSKVKKGDVVRALIVRTRFGNRRPFSETITHTENAVILLNKQNKLLGTRIFGSLSRDFRFTPFLKALTISSGVLV